MPIELTDADVMQPAQPQAAPSAELSDSDVMQPIQKGFFENTKDVAASAISGVFHPSQYKSITANAEQYLISQGMAPEDAAREAAAVRFLLPVTAIVAIDFLL